MPQVLTQHFSAFANQALHLGVWLVLLTIIFVPLERWFALQPKHLRAKTQVADIGYYFLNSLLPAAILSVPVALLAAGVRQVTPAAFSEAVASLPLWARLVAGLVVSDIGSYWGHRWSHESPFLWRFHAVHHSPEHLNWMMNTRAHPVDMVFTRLCGLVPLYALGLAQSNHGVSGDMVPVYVTLIGTVWSFFIHADVRWRLGPIEWVISTPAFHHWHHTNDHNRDRNYAAILPWIDRLFGTHFLPGHWPPVYGIDHPVAPGMKAQLLDPMTGFRTTPTTIVQAEGAKPGHEQLASD